MKQNGRSRNEVLMVGIGGQGVLMAGQLFVESASQRYEHVTYISSYGFARRGGLCECTVIVSDDKIASPVIDQVQSVMLLDSSQFAGFEPRVRPGGVIIADTAGLSAEQSREDYTLHTLPCLDIAQSMGSILGKNQIMLGAFVVITGAVPPELIEEVLNERFKAKEKVREQNLAAFRRGVELGRSVV